MIMQKHNWKMLLLIGLTAGLVQALAGMAMYVSGVYFASWSMLASLGVLVLCLIVGIVWYRNRAMAGSLSYSQALMAGVVISVATGLVYAIYNVISVSFLYPHFLEQMVSNGVARIQAMGLGAEQTAALIAGLKSGATLPAIALGNLVRLSVFGSVLSAILSIFLKRKSSNEAEA